MPPNLETEDERQRRVIEHFRADSRTLCGADLLETFFEDLRSVVHDRLGQIEKERRAAPNARPPAKELLQVYMIYDRRDELHVAAWADSLFEKGLEVVRPVFEGDEAEIRDYHDENLRTCDAALIFYGAANECWLRRKLRELQKSAGYGRSKPAPLVGIALTAPRTGEKERFRTHEAMVIPQFEGFSPECLEPFMARLEG
jgi:hypothetical protein